MRAGAPLESLLLGCPNCGADLRCIAFVTEDAPVEQILAHIGEPSRPPPIAPVRGPPGWDDDLGQVPDWNFSNSPSRRRV
jgi:hypothetical protein